MSITNEENLKSFKSAAKYVDGGAVLGYGTTEGGNMYMKSSYTGQDELIEDTSSYPRKPAVSVIDEDNLKSIADDMDVKYINMNDASNIDTTINKIKRESASESKDGKVSGYADIYYIFAAMLVSNNYIMDGGNGYTMLAGLPKYGETGGELETVQAYLEKCLAENTLADYAVPQGRITMRGDIYEPKDYTASIRIVDGAGRTLPNQMLSYRVDGGDGTDGVTDENGILHVTLSDGAHSIRISEGRGTYM